MQMDRDVSRTCGGHCRRRSRDVRRANGCVHPGIVKVTDAASSTTSQSTQIDRTTEAGNDRNAFWRPRWARGQGAVGEGGVDGMRMGWSMGSVRIRWRLAAISGGNCDRPEPCTWATASGRWRHHVHARGHRSAAQGDQPVGEPATVVGGSWGAPPWRLPTSSAFTDPRGAKRYALT